MKIDFDGSYRDIARLLRTPNSGVGTRVGGQSFDGTLDALSKQATEKSRDLPQQAPIADSQEDTRARLQFNLPNLIGPETNRIAPPQTPVTQDQTPGASVKTPTVLEVKRVKLEPGAYSANVAKVQGLVQAAGLKHGVDPALAMAMVKNESSFNPKAISTDGAESKGLFQLIDSTGKGMLEKDGIESKYDPFNPEMNVDLGVSYLRYLHDIFSSSTTLPNKLQTKAASNPESLEKIAVAAFNAGEGRVASAQSRASAAGLDPAVYSNIERYLPRSTQEYVARVITSKQSFAD